MYETDIDRILYTAHRRVSHMQGFSTLYNIGKLILFFMVQYLSHIGKIV
jgi:hypothetical protein